MKKTCRRLTPAQIAYIQLLHREGRSVKAISDTVKRSKSTVRFWTRRPDVTLKEVGVRKPHAVSKALKARRAVVAGLALKKATKKGKTRPLHCSASSISTALFKASKTRWSVSRWTVARDLRASGFESRVRQNVPTTAAGDQKRRLAACKRFVRCRRRKVFSDEKIFTTNDYGCRTQWVKKGTVPLNKERARWPTRVHVWAAIGHDFVTWAVLPNDTTSSGTPNPNVIFKLDCEGYIRRCLPRVVPHCLMTKSLFMQDGARVHTAKRTSALLARKGVELLAPWPPRSPDLNPIENLWAIVQRAVSEQRPTTYDELVDAINDSFAAVPQSTINALVASFPGRCRRVISRGGAF